MRDEGRRHGREEHEYERISGEGRGREQEPAHLYRRRGRHERSPAEKRFVDSSSESSEEGVVLTKSRGGQGILTLLPEDFRSLIERRGDSGSSSSESSTDSAREEVRGSWVVVLWYTKGRWIPWGA